MCDRFTAALERRASTRTSGGGYSFTYTTGNRGTKPISVRADFQTMTSEERTEYGLTGEYKLWCMYTASDPKLETEDRVTWTDNSSLSRVCDVVNPSFAMAGRAKIWKTIVEEKESQT